MQRPDSPARRVTPQERKREDAMAWISFLLGVIAVAGFVALIWIIYA